MAQMTVDVPDDLVQELHSHHDHLPTLLQMGLAEWRKQESRFTTNQVEQVLEQLADEGKLIRPRVPKNHKQRIPRMLVSVKGKLTSELVSELRNQ